MRTSAYFQDYVSTGGQDYAWAKDSGKLLVLDKDSHVEWSGISSEPSKYVARMIWNYNTTSGNVDSWELLLNVSLLDRLYPNNHPLPSIGDMVILTVQNGGNAFTDALVRTVAPVPEPATIVMWSLLGLTMVGFGYWRRKRAA